MQLSFQLQLQHSLPMKLEELIVNEPPAIQEHIKHLIDKRNSNMVLVVEDCHAIGRITTGLLSLEEQSILLKTIHVLLPLSLMMLLKYVNSTDTCFEVLNTAVKNTQKSLVETTVLVVTSVLMESKNMVSFFLYSDTPCCFIRKSRDLSYKQ